MKFATVLILLALAGCGANGAPEPVGVKTDILLGPKGVNVVVPLGEPSEGVDVRLGV